MIKPGLLRSTLLRAYSKLCDRNEPSDGIGGKIMCDRNWQMERTKFVLTQRNNDTFSGDAQNKGKNPSLQEKKHQCLDRYFKRVK